MKVFALLIASVAAVRFIDNSQDIAEANSFAQGVPVKDMQPPRHWSKQWPQGHVDDGSNDEDVLKVAPGPGVVENQKPKEKYYSYPAAKKGQWPYKKIDDGTDDASVMNAAIAEEGMITEI